MDETSILQSVCSCIGGQQNVSRVLSSGNKRYLMVKDASAVDLTAVRQVEGVQAAELSRGRLTLELPGNDKEEKMDHKQVAQGIIENVGGKENIASFTHCATRLRLKLRDNAKANKDAVCKVKGVINVVEKRRPVPGRHRQRSGSGVRRRAGDHRHFRSGRGHRGEG